MAERDVVRKILKQIKDRGGYAVKIHGGPTQSRTIDIHACYKGRFFGIEAKASYKEDPTDYQKFTLDEIIRAGGIAIVAWDAGQVAAVLDYIDTMELHGMNGFKWG